MNFIMFPICTREINKMLKLSKVKCLYPTQKLNSGVEICDTGNRGNLLYTTDEKLEGIRQLNTVVGCRIE